MFSQMLSREPAIDYNDMMNQYDAADMDKGMFKPGQDNQKQSKESGGLNLTPFIGDIVYTCNLQARVM